MTPSPSQPELVEAFEPASVDGAPLSARSTVELAEAELTASKLAASELAATPLAATGPASDQALTLVDLRLSQPRAPRIDAPNDVAFTVALALMALLPRLFVALAWAREPVWDGHYYHFGATRLAEGLGYSEDVVLNGIRVWKPWTHYPVGYSGILSLAYRAFGSSITVAPLVNAVIGTLLVVVVHRLARYAVSQSRARIAGALCALHPGLIAYSAIVMTEPSAALFVLAAGWAAVALRSRWQLAVISAGVLIGLGALIRPVSLLAVPALMLVGPRPLWQSMLRAGAVGLVALITIAPWTARNCRVMDGCALISTNGGWNLAIGALTTTGRFHTLRADDGCPIVTGQVQQDRCWADVGRRIILRDPLAFLALVPKKLSQTYNHESYPIEYLKEGAPELWPEERRRAGRDLLTTWHWVLMGAAALSPIALINSQRRKLGSATQGALLLLLVAYVSFCFASPEHPFFALAVMMPLLGLLPFPGRPSFGPAGRYLLGLVFATTLTHAVFFGEDRYHLVISPVLCILAAAALRKRHAPAAWAPE